MSGADLAPEGVCGAPGGETQEVCAGVAVTFDPDLTGEERTAAGVAGVAGAAGGTGTAAGGVAAMLVVTTVATVTTSAATERVAEAAGCRFLPALPPCRFPLFSAV